ncbi:DUF2691 family protein [Neobacillus sp. SCS-31]|uniref:DUF2691 family protein n=1 Tax=Neobacillus oceani TaxID=3115292 RepID=UPI003906067F
MNNEKYEQVPRPFKSRYLFLNLGKYRVILTWAVPIVDSSYVTIYLKDEVAIKHIYSKAITAGYKNIEYTTDENDERTTLTAFKKFSQ